MVSLPWLGVSYADKKVTLQANKPSFSSPYRSCNLSSPLVITFAGKHDKARYLALILDWVEPLEHHGQVRITTNGCATDKTRDIFLDCELTLDDSIVSEKESHAAISRSIDWLPNNQQSATEFPDQVIAHVLAPLSSIICIFAADFHGLDGVACHLARQATLPRAHTLPLDILPHLLVVVNMGSRAGDPEKASQDLRLWIIKEMKQYKAYNDHDDAVRELESKFRGIQVVGMHRRDSYIKRSEKLKQHLESLREEMYWVRRKSRYLFNSRHLDALSNRLVLTFCNSGTCFDFLQESRPRLFDATQLKSHITELLQLIPGQSWIWSIVVPLLASALCLASYPPGSHKFSPDTFFAEFFAVPCIQAIGSYTQDESTQKQFVASVKNGMEETFRRLEFDPESDSVLNQHSDCLEKLWPHVAQLKSSRSCLSCLMFAPEKVFQCGHAICNNCVRRFGRSSREGIHSFEIGCCILCGYNQSFDTGCFQLTPPTAGIRILCLDGGGVKGVMQLIFLQYLEDEMRVLGGSLQDMFDYICGTSAGGLIAIGLFLMRWTASDCLERFEDLSMTVFKAEERNSKLTWSQKLQVLFQAWVNDHRYAQSPIERAFQSTLSSATKIFNPIQSDTKVAVTATSVRANIPCVISNYNGNSRSDDNNYFHIRAAQHNHDMTISEAAACTSAAPYFFKSKDVDHLDTFQDGGLRYNNPALLASWECGNIWPERCRIFDADPSSVQVDHMISLGTGTSLCNKYEVGPHSPKKDRFFKRLFGNHMSHLDGEEQWKTFYRCVPADLRNRYHRLNVSLPGKEPALDDVAAMESMKDAASQFVRSAPQITAVKNTIIASIFYFEIDEVTQINNGSHRCHGTVFCRLPLDLPKRRILYERLLQKKAFFVARGQTVPCNPSTPKGIPVFRRSLDFVVKNMDERFQILVTGITSEPTCISGMPTNLDNLLKLQGLEMPFGCIDNRPTEKQLPMVPLKRKLREH